MRRGRVGALDVWIPQTRRERVLGLRGRSRLGPSEGLLLERCRSVHTFGMRFAIDAVLLDRERRVVGVVRMAPRRILRPRRHVRHVLEVAAGAGALAILLGLPRTSLGPHRLEA